MTRQHATVFFGALFFLTATAETLSAQGRGRGNRMGGPVRTAPLPRVASPPAFVGRVPTPGVAPRVIIGRPRVIRPQFRGIFPQQFVGPYSSYLWAPPVYAPPAYVAPTYITPSVTQNELELTYEVQRLSREIEQLRQEQAAATLRQLTPQAPPPPPARETPATPAILVFRDGRRLSIQNYAIVGQTLWVLDEQTSTKVPLSDLDLEATQKENRDQGVRFSLPTR